MVVLPGAVIVEGHGEVGAVDNLLNRMCSGRGPRWLPARRWPGLQSGAMRVKALEAHRNRSIGALLLLRDEDDACPARTGPGLSAEAAALALPFPIASVLLKPEYEVLFLPCLGRMAGRPIGGRPGLKADARWDGSSWEARRGVKEWLTAHMDGGKAYKPSMDQLALTRMIDLDELQGADVPCFGTLSRAMGFLFEHWGDPGVVYPPASSSPSG